MNRLRKKYLRENEIKKRLEFEATVGKCVLEFIAHFWIFQLYKPQSTTTT